MVMLVDMWYVLLRCNVDMVFFMIWVVVLVMVLCGWGCVVMVGSFIGLVMAMVGDVVYAMVKVVLVGLTRVAVLDVVFLGVMVNVVVLGWVVIVF